MDQVGCAWAAPAALLSWPCLLAARLKIHLPCSPRHLCSKADSSFEHTADGKAATLVPCGCLPVEQLDAYLARLDRLLAKAQERHDEKRSSHGSKRQGHQKTPAMILTLAQQVGVPVECLTPMSMHAVGAVGAGTVQQP